MLSFVNLAKSLILAVQKNNKENPEVKTADESVFKDLENEVEQVNKDYDMTSSNSRADAYKEMRRRMEQVQQNNEANPDVETAHSSVFEEMQRKIEALQRQLESQQNPAQTQQSSNQALAFVHGMGGSLALRTEASMGAPQIEVRVPDNATVTILQQSNQAIVLDGEKSSFVYVDYNGTRGWILDAYLNRG